jgi:hypothetical protein
LKLLARDFYRATSATAASRPARRLAPRFVLLLNMASKVTMDASAVSKPKPSTATPIEALGNDTARVYTCLHPFVILSLYAYKFQDIVANPVPALLSILGPLAVLQIAFVAVCLPPTGETLKFEKRKPGEKRKYAPGKLATGINGKVVVRLHMRPADYVATGLVQR